MFKTRKQKTQDEADTFSTNEVVRIFKVSHRQLQWWDERGLVSPDHVEAESSTVHALVEGKSECERETVVGFAFTFSKKLLP